MSKEDSNSRTYVARVITQLHFFRKKIQDVPNKVINKGKGEMFVPLRQQMRPSVDLIRFFHNSDKKYTIFTHKIYNIFITFMIK